MQTQSYPNPLRVYKFGGASVRSAEGVENLSRIVAAQPGPLFVVVSAMGKTTNALETVLEAFMGYRDAEALNRFEAIEQMHRAMMEALFTGTARQTAEARLDDLFAQVRRWIGSATSRDDYDRWYDRLVGYGELFSTVIVSLYLQEQGIPNRWIDMRQCFVTDSRYREANINIDRSAERLQQALAGASERVFVGQGFIGATAAGHPTTLGREGSDYSAAMVGYLLDAESVTIWKDVEGILNGDPRLFDDTVYIPQLTYLDAIELAYSGAQVIHPKTIKPLQNKHIPLYVRPFSDPGKPGTVICGRIDRPVGVPIRILKQRQVLVSVRPKDFSFVLEERLGDIFAVFQQYHLKINLIQSSAVNLSVCVDESRYLERVIDTLQVDFRVVYNQGVELLTVRGYDEASYDRYVEAPGVMLVQKTRRTVRLVRKAQMSC